MIKRIVIALSIIALSAPLFGQTVDDRKKKAESLVRKASAACKEQGQEKAFAAINDKKGPFTEGEYYIFVYDLDGICQAHGLQPEKIGKALIDLKDINGYPYMMHFVRTAKGEKGEGWVDYVQKNPTTGKPQKKTSFILRVPGKNFFMGCGTYLND
ncbi:MAG: cache domain-containing protein [Spirochaetes bacterium]|nr:cache domain-containing protein [Spirochaetota bacterium]